VGLLSVVGHLIGTAAYVGNRGAREAAHRNLSRIAPDLGMRARRHLARMTFVHNAWAHIEMLGLGSLTAEDLKARYPIDGMEHIDAARTQGRGVIMVTAHVGAPNTAGQAIALHGVPTTLVVEQLQPPPLHDFVARLRGAFGVRIVTVGRESVREMIAALRRNELVGIVADRDVAGTGRILSFFGTPTRVTTAPATLALRTGAVVLPAFAARSRLFTGSARIEPPVEIPRTGDTYADVSEGTLRILQRIEAFIREYPDQWGVFAHVWPSESPADEELTLGTMPKP
jgi:KDO2-lipid IV(A) lauroyltransferase